MDPMGNSHSQVKEETTLKDVNVMFFFCMEKQHIDR